MSCSGCWKGICFHTKSQRENSNEIKMQNLRGLALRHTFHIHIKNLQKIGLLRALKFKCPNPEKEIHACQYCLIQLLLKFFKDPKYTEKKFLKVIKNKLDYPTYQYSLNQLNSLTLSSKFGSLVHWLVLKQKKKICFRVLGLFCEKIDVYGTDVEGKSVCHYAIENGDFKTFKFLLGFYCDVFRTNFSVIYKINNVKKSTNFRDDEVKESVLETCLRKENLKFFDVLCKKLAKSFTEEENRILMMKLLLFKKLDHLKVYVARNPDSMKKSIPLENACDVFVSIWGKEIINGPAFLNLVNLFLGYGVTPLEFFLRILKKETKETEKIRKFLKKNNPPIFVPDVYVYMEDYFNPDVICSIVEKETRTCGCCNRSGIGFKKCSACKRTFYCSRECQEKIWKQHKNNCKKWRAKIK